MTKNQKIALGCGGAGCFGLIVIAVVGVILFFVYGKRSYEYTAKNHNSNSNISSNTNRNANSSSTKTNDNSASNENRNSNTSISSSSTSMSEDDKHKLFQAVSGTRDTELMHQVWKKLGLMNNDGTLNDSYAEFVKAHVSWLFANSDFLQIVNTPEKARAYVESHLND
ncbi:MAG: hypothetical protein ABR555_09470 [Pyrinomonadaceae bacterium]